MIKHIPVAILAATAVPAMAVTYNATPIDQAGYPTIIPYGLGPDGTVVGQTTGSYLPVVRGADGTITVLPTLGGARGSINAVNAAGTLAGEARTGATVGSNRPFVRSASGTTTVIAIPAGADLGGARAINTAGEVAGDFQTPGNFQTFVWDAAHGTTVLDLPGGATRDTVAYGINARGEVLGISYDQGFGPDEIVRWSAAGIATVISGSAAAPHLTLGEFNDAGTIVGAVRIGEVNPFLEHATVWDAAGHPTDVGTLAGDNTSVLTAINNHGVAVGYSGIVDDNAVISGRRLVSWTRRGGLQPLIVNGGFAGLLTEAIAINDAGQILRRPRSGRSVRRRHRRRQRRHPDAYRRRTRACAMGPFDHRLGARRRYAAATAVARLTLTVRVAADEGPPPPFRPV